MEKEKVLIVGLGNIDRADDGVAWWIVNAFRKRFGLSPLGEYETGLEKAQGSIDAIFLQQLTPELLENLLSYRTIIFVDAHVMSSEVCVSAVKPNYESLMFTHHLTPSMLLAFLKDLYNHEPSAYIVSVRGYNFNFQRGLSPQTEKLLESAIFHIEQLLRHGDMEDDQF